MGVVALVGAKNALGFFKRESKIKGSIFFFLGFISINRMVPVHLDGFRPSTLWNLPPVPFLFGHNLDLCVESSCYRWLPTLSK